MSDIELKPCLWCSGRVVFLSSNAPDNHYGVCGICGAEGPCGTTEEGAIEAWNDRPSSVDKWISVEEQMPEPGNDEILLAWGDSVEIGGYVPAGFYVDGGNTDEPLWCYFNGAWKRYPNQGVTDWKPLLPPQTGEDK